MGLLSTLTIISTIAFFLLFFIERRTLWIGPFFIGWIGILLMSILILFERFERTLALAVGLILVGILVVGLPFYLLSFIWLLITSGRKLIKREGRRLRNFLSLAFGLFLIGWLIFLPMFMLNPRTSFQLFLVGVITVSVYYFFFLMALFALASVLNRVPIPFKKYDYVIVLGSGLIGDKVPPLLASRIDKGIDCFKRYHKPEHPVKVIFTGGQGGDEKLPEGVAMAKYAMEKGLPEEHIIIEEQAVNTYENLLFSKQLIDADRRKEGKKGKYHIVTVTNNFHVFRALLWARKVGIKSDGIGSKTKFYFWLNALIREFIGVVYMQKKFHIVILLLSYVAVLALVLIDYYFVVPYKP